MPRRGSSHYGHQHRCRFYNLRIDITVPGDEIVVMHKGARNPTHKDVYVAIRDAFEAAGRRLEEHARRLQGATKAHAAARHETAELVPQEG